MRISLFYLFTFLFQSVFAQQFDKDIYPMFKTEAAPFYFGVASGDPTSNSVLIWTKLVSTDFSPKSVRWEIALDTSFSRLVSEGDITIDSSTAYSMTVRVSGLDAGKHYFYRFSHLNQFSPIGRTKTAPISADSLKFAVVSCNNFESGYFNAFYDIAKRSDIDAVIHLGDYIYEYSRGNYGRNDAARQHIPAHEILDLSDYRSRYAQYRLDPNLQEMHRLHPIIAIWDDHEFANNAHLRGAQNHQESEGDWELRKRIAKKVYFEWLPVSSATTTGVIRKLEYGDLATLFMLDGRIKGRSKQLSHYTDSAYQSLDRYMLGNEQVDWLISGIRNSKSKWTLIGNQVIFSELDAGHLTKKNAKFMDTWDGYPVERNYIMDAFYKNSFKNIIFLTGDIHTAWGIDLAASPQNNNSYNRKTGHGVIGAEFVTPSISSSNLDERVDRNLAKLVGSLMKSPARNPHIRYVNMVDHGYLVLTLSSNTAQSSWHYCQTVREQNFNMRKKVPSWYLEYNANKLRKVN